MLSIQILRKMNIVKSAQLQKRVYKMIVVIDLAGLGTPLLYLAGELWLAV
jgi:hypothetical protein